MPNERRAKATTMSGFGGPAWYLLTGIYRGHPPNPAPATPRAWRVDAFQDGRALGMPGREFSSRVAADQWAERLNEATAKPALVQWRVIAASDWQGKAVKEWKP